MTATSLPAETPAALDTGALASAVGVLLADATAQLGEWSSRSIYSPVKMDTLGVYRVGKPTPTGR